MNRNFHREFCHAICVAFFADINGCLEIVSKWH